MSSQYAVGLCLGTNGEPSALSIIERSTYPSFPDTRRQESRFTVRNLHRFAAGATYASIIGDVRKLTAKAPLPGSPLVVDTTLIGRPIVDQFRTAGLPVQVVPVTITGIAQSPLPGGVWSVPKVDLVGLMETLVQDKRFQIVPSLPEAETLKRELTQFKFTGVNDRLRERDFDDVLLSVSLACWYFARGRQALMYGAEFTNTPALEAAQEQLASDPMAGHAELMASRLPFPPKSQEQIDYEKAVEELSKQDPLWYLRLNTDHIEDGWAGWR
jgi:hypothetical protein